MYIPLPRLYPITDRLLSGLSHAEQVARLCEGGIRLVQLREKHLSPREFYSEAEEALKVARSNGVRVVINDRVDIALALGADGVHLGQQDMPPRAARELLGEGAIIGFSTHSVEQAISAARLPVDYIAIGPVFATSSKENPEEVVGLEGVRLVREAVGRVREPVGRVPLVAIGGITRERSRAVLESGADSLAVIGALLAPAGALLTHSDSAEITRRTRAFLAGL